MNAERVILLKSIWLADGLSHEAAEARAFAAARVLEQSGVVPVTWRELFRGCGCAMLAGAVAAFALLAVVLAVVGP